MSATPPPPELRANPFVVYVGRIREFERGDWMVYLAWVAMLVALVGSTAGFLLVGRARGVAWPDEAWLVPVGAGIFAIAMAIDLIGHRTIYKAALQGGEHLVHHIAIGCSVGSVMCLVAARKHHAMWIPAIVLTVLSFVYSFVDEVFHWRRYVKRETDVVEMWSHVGILVGHGIMMVAWWRCFQLGYPGVAETLAALKGS